MSVEVSGDPGAHDDASIPAARRADLIVTESDDEVVIYDKTAKHIHHLNAVSAAVWLHCDGRRTVAEIAAAASEAIGATVDEDAMAIALDKLGEANLLTEPVTIRRTSRRRFVKKAAIVAPAVVSITAPIASASASSCPDGHILQSTCQIHKARADGRCCKLDSNESITGICREVTSGRYDCDTSQNGFRWFG